MRRLLVALVLVAPIAVQAAGPAVAVSAPAPAAVVVPPAPAGVAPFAGRGPYTVGVRTFTIGTGAAASPVELWYPGDRTKLAPGAPKASYDLKQWLPADDQAKIGAASPAVSVTDAYRDLPVRPGGPYPVVLFSHGFGGYRVQSAFLTTHLASWGFVVAAPQHRGRDLAAVLGGRLSFGDSGDQADLRATLTLLAAQQKAGPLAGRIDLAHVAATGHSAGANAAVKLAAGDARVGAVVAMAGGGISLLGGATDPKKPVLFLGGTGDGVVSAASMRTAYAGASAPKRLVMITGAGHLAFADICVTDAQTGGLRTIAKKYGIEVPFVLNQLGTDGCAPPDIPVQQAWPIVRQFTVAELRAVFAGTPAASAAGLDQATADALGPAKATVTAALR